MKKRKKLKGINKINNYLNSWLKNHKFGSCKTTLGLDFAYDFEDDQIIYGLLIGTSSLDSYFKFVKTLGLKYICDPFTVAFFHELGHRQTFHKLSEDEINLSDEISEYYNNLDEKIPLTESDYFAYYTSPMEFEATKWAIKYINKHPKRIFKFQNNICRLLQDFYKKNNIID